jgi:hypothetical protein
MLVVIAVTIAALACAAGFVYYRRRAPAAHKKDDPLQKSLLDGGELEMGSLGPNVPHTSQPDIPHTSQPDIPHIPPPLDMDPNALNPVGSPEFDPDEGFPTNDSARALCAKQWTAHRDLNTSFAGDGAAQHTTEVQYADLQAATSSFSDSHKIGDGGSCVVYKAKLYGVLCAVCDQAAVARRERMGEEAVRCRDQCADSRQAPEYLPALRVLH